MGTLQRRIGSATIRWSGDALLVDEVRAPDVATVTVEAGETTEITIANHSAAVDWQVEVQGLTAGWYTLSHQGWHALFVLHPPHSDTIAPPGEYGFAFHVRVDTARSAITGRVRLLPPGGTSMSSRLLDYLPGIFKDADPFMGRFLLIFQSLLDPLEHLVDSTYVYLDPDLAPARFLPWLARWVGVVLDPSLDEAQQRQYIRQAVDLHRWKGTKRALRNELAIRLNAEVLIVENFAGLRLGEDARLGINTQIGERRDGSLTITVIGARALDPLKIGEMVAGLVPADVEYTVRTVAGPTPTPGRGHA